MTIWVTMASLNGLLFSSAARDASAAFSCAASWTKIAVRYGEPWSQNCWSFTVGSMLCQ
jgi:hypothetical protein